jgi:hypothetical protein
MRHPPAGIERLALAQHSGFAAKDATLAILMVEFGATDMARAARSQIYFRGGQHADQWRGKINPQVGPMARRHG